MQKKLNILIIDNSHAVTGAFKSIFFFTHALSSSFNFYYAIPLYSRLSEYLRLKGKRFITLNFVEISKHWRVFFYFPMLIYNSLRISRFINSHSISIVHVNDLYNMSGVLLKVLNPHIRLIYHIRLLPGSYVNKLYRVWVRLIVRYADRVICVSEAVKKSIPTSEKVTVIYDTIDNAVFPAYEKRKSETESVNLLYLANYIPGKGHDLAIKAFSQVVKGNPEISMRMIGGDLGKKKNRDYKNRLVELAAKENLDITFGDFEEDTHRVFREADVFLNFSESESFSMTCLEALYYGTPVIATNCGGPAEIIEHGVSGWLVPNKDVAAMAEAIIKLAQDKDLRKTFIENGKLRVQSKFHATTQCRLLHEVYNR